MQAEERSSRPGNPGVEKSLPEVRLEVRVYGSVRDLYASRGSRERPLNTDVDS